MFSPQWLRGPPASPVARSAVDGSQRVKSEALPEVQVVKPQSSPRSLVGTLERMRVRGHHQKLVEPDDTAMAGVTNSRSPSTNPAVLAVAPTVELEMGSHGGNPEARVFTRSPESAKASKLARAFDRVRGRDRHLLVESDEEKPRTSTPDSAVLRYDTASGPNASAVTGLGLASTHSANVRLSPGGHAAGNMSMALDRMHGRQHWEEDKTQAAPASRGAYGLSDEIGATPWQREEVPELQPRLLGASRWGVRDALSKFGGRRTERLI